MYTPVNPSFYYIKVGCNGVFITRTCFPDACDLRHVDRLIRFNFDKVGSQFENGCN